MAEAERTVGRYHIVRRIGRGGMAVVHLARQIDLGRLVALKELNALDAGDPSYARRFIRESRLAGSLGHPNIVTVFDYFEHDGTPYIAMEYVSRGSLRPYVGRMTLEQTLGVLEGVLSALAHAHSHTDAEADGVVERTIVHRDLKPENVLVAPDGRVKLADFGIAKALDEVQTGGFRTATGMTVGTPAYMAPEQAMAGDVGPWTDLYAVGCMARELFIGDLPFADTDSPWALLLRRINEDIPSLRATNPRVPADLAGWVDRLLVRDPNERTRSAGSALEELEDIAIGTAGPRWHRRSLLPEAVATGERQDPFAESHAPGVEAPPPRSPEAEAEPEAPPIGTVTPPPDDAMSVPDAIPGPWTPPPDDAIVPAALSGAEFVTYEAPPPVRPPTDADAAEPPAQAPPPDAAEPPAQAPPPDAAEPPAQAPPPDAGEPPAAPPETAPQAAELAPTVTRRGTDRPPPADRASRPRRPVRAIAIGAVALLVLAAGAVAVLTGGGDGRARSPARASSTTLAAGAVRVPLPPGWAKLPAPVEIPGLELADAISIAPGGTAGAGAALIGAAPRSAHRASLLPTALTEALGLRPDVVPDSDRVHLRAGGLEALRYQSLRPKGLGRAVTVYAAPTSAGVATLACVAPARGTERFDADCARLASSLTVPGAKAFPLGPSRAYADAVSGAVGGLDRVLAKGRGGLAAARTAPGQAAPAAAIATGFGDAGAGLEHVKLSPADEELNRDLALALRSAQTGYGRLAATARGSDRARYRDAASAAERGEQRVERALRALSRSGYRELVTARFSPRAIPLKPARRPRARPTPTATPTPGPTATATAVPTSTATAIATATATATVICDFDCTGDQN